MQATGVLLGGLSDRRFLEEHWQKRPLLVRGAVPDLALPFAAAELPALACDPSVPSRLVVRPQEGLSGGADGWRTRRGPLSTADLAALPADGWTILLHEMDRRFDGLAGLLERFRFIPNWRIDDIMVSYARDGGGVGPHIDRYDVFLLQAAGRRRWRVGGSPLGEERLVPGLEHAVLEHFEPAEEWVLEPGDMLYLPPRFAHDGIAVGECVTCSIGFRAPDPRELCAGFLRQLGPDAFEAIRYADPDLTPADRPGELPAAARRELRESALGLFSRAAAFDDWVGRFVTTPARGTALPGGSAFDLESLRHRLEGGGSLRRSAPTHFVWFRDADAAIRLFVGGEAYRLAPGSETVAELLCGTAQLTHAALAPHLGNEPFVAILRDLLLRGFLIPDPTGV